MRIDAEDEYKLSSKIADWFVEQCKLEGELYDSATELLKKRKQTLGSIKAALGLGTKDAKILLIALKEIHGEALKFEGKTRHRRYWIEEI